MRNLCLILLHCLLMLNVSAQQNKDTLKLADPTIFLDKGTYYLYGTSSPNGFLVYTSRDLKHWSAPAGKRNGLALLKGDSYGKSGFWAPQVWTSNGKYYMAYTADENIAIAESNSPLGPFIQTAPKRISGSDKQIDPYVFKDSDGKLYLYHVRLQSGNRIYVARLKEDLSDIYPETAIECINAEEPWENTDKVSWPVAEGPTVIKRENLYYLFYSANDFRNKSYSVGYATSESPLGPWKKFAGNPIISYKNTGHNGSGHGDIFSSTKGTLYYVFHTHSSAQNVGQRKTAIVNLAFSKQGSATIDPASFRFLFENKPR
ncbi:glycoside hydrolase family 43 protein [Desertivirga arenae]|uniref:glycoside hydrolase family 43 protein n=1 Tax=Desertivirga arenae TaxID=2810309 RepID=UPI001A95D007|nr:glycoside hydrolase family 43 protein [Pedobacter sp. SYSU D00823]